MAPIMSTDVSEGSACSAPSAGHEELSNALGPPQRTPSSVVAVLISGCGFGQDSGDGMDLQTRSRVHVEGLVSQHCSRS